MAPLRAIIHINRMVTKIRRYYYKDRILTGLRVECDNHTQKKHLVEKNKRSGNDRLVIGPELGPPPVPCCSCRRETL